MAKVYAMREVYVISFVIFLFPLPQQKKKTKEQKRPARKETTVSRRAPPCLLRRRHLGELGGSFHIRLVNLSLSR